jgi:chromosome segregation ATPase
MVRRHEQHGRQLERQAKQIARLKADLAAVQGRLKPVELDSNHREIEHGRLSVQVGVLETRLNQLEERLGAGTFVADDAQAAEARSLVEAVRREHEQVRARLQLVSSYEERLRRVEEAVVGRSDGDRRHPV